MTTQDENAATNRGSTDGSLRTLQVQPEEVVLGLTSNTTTSVRYDACSQELEQLAADARNSQQHDTGHSSPTSMKSLEKPIQRRGITTQTIPSRCVRSPRRLLEVLKSKYGEKGYTVEMRHNVYTVVTWDGKGELSQASLSGLGWG